MEAEERIGLRRNLLKSIEAVLVVLLRASEVAIFGIEQFLMRISNEDFVVLVKRTEEEEEWHYIGNLAKGKLN